MNEPAYGIRSLIHSYDGKIALDFPSLDIPAGRICGFVGPNGCGKTTLLAILALLRRPVKGTLYLHGTEVTGERSALLRRKVTLVHQKPVLFSTTVRNNLAYGLKLSGFSSKEISARVDAAIEEAGLTELAGRQARTLSGGEAQRAVLVRGLVLERPILLLDEPTNSLDEAFRPKLVELLRKANHSRNATIVVASHDMSFVGEVADIILRLDAGALMKE